MENINPRRSGDLIAVELLSLVQDIDIKVNRQKIETDDLVKKIESIEDKLSRIIVELENYKRPWFARWFGRS